ALERAVLRADDVEAILGTVDFNRGRSKLRLQVGKLFAQFLVGELRPLDFRLLGSDHVAEVHITSHQIPKCGDTQERSRCTRDLRSAAQRDVGYLALSADQNLPLGEKPRAPLCQLADHAPPARFNAPYNSTPESEREPASERLQPPRALLRQLSGDAISTEF